MKNYFIKLLQVILIALDLVFINISFFLLVYIFIHYHYLSAFREYADFYLYFNFSWIAICMASNVYAERNLHSFESYTKKSMNAFVYFLGAILFYIVIFHLQVISRLFLVMLFGMVSIFLLLNRFTYIFIYNYFKSQEYLINRMIIIGYNPVAKKLVEYVESGALNAEIIGYCEEEGNIQEITNYPILGSIDQTLSSCNLYHATVIYSTITPEQNHKIYELMRSADQQCIRFKIVPDLGIFIKQRLFIDFVNDLPVLSIRNEPLEDLGNRLKKRAFDLIVSTLAIIFILSFLIPIIGLLIKLGSKGPVFFKQARSAKNNKSFGLLKFRSMVVNAQSDSLQARIGDTRITRIGKFLRKTSLDEFPQFLNVFVGDMSVVGPRPHMLKHTEEYSRILNRYMVRQFIKPGITGWAQVNGYRGETINITQMEERVKHDIWYMENWSLWLDVKIVFLTFVHLFNGSSKVF